MEKAYVYIFVRKDLPSSQKVVQCSHAAWELREKSNLGYHPSMIVISIKNEFQLKKHYELYRELGLVCSSFYEPIFDNTMTSFAVLAENSEQRKLFQKFNLLNDKSFCKEGV